MFQKKIAFTSYDLFESLPFDVDIVGLSLDDLDFSMRSCGCNGCV